MRDKRDGSQKRVRSPSTDSRQSKRHRPQEDKRPVTDEKQRKSDSQSDKKGKFTFLIVVLDSIQ